ncbi:DNA/RNA non-specific endonuclease, partial [Chryseobacterium sp. VD8]|uniref:DNA/RNA non-specific endonuclease n=1 Tax=Chryseobacterium sp. VD8 TaxID=3081254 RepID=UPI003016D018
HGDQQQTSAKDSQKRKEIADHINGIYVSSKADVDVILNNLDTTVAKKFDEGSREAKKAFEAHVDKEMKAYKKKRYGDAYADYGALAAAGKWIWDKLTGLPEEVNKFFDSGKDLYIKVMDKFIDQIATHVTTQLNAAKTRIAKGKKDVQTYVDSLSPSLRKIGKEAIAEIQSKFNALEESVNSKKDALIDVLAKKYADNIASIDTRIADLKAQNSGLINKALDVLKTSVFAIIIEIKNTLTNLLSGVISAIQAIIMDPIGFFKNLIAGVSQGFTNFGTNIWTHLKAGFFGWLTGAMKGISFTMPEDVFSLKGIFSITTQVLGLTWDGIRSIGARVIGEPVMKVLETASEKGLEIIPIVRKDGAAGLWEYLKDQFADLKATVMDAMMDIIQTQVIQAGIKWVMGLMTPVGAFIKAAMAIIDMVKFFIQRAAQIMELVKAFTDSIKAIASGNVSAVAKSIENALGRAVPVLIGFLASLLGIGGLADKILGVIRKIRQRIENAIVKFWSFIKGKAAKLLSKVGIGKLGKKKDKVDEKHIKNMDSEIAPEPFTMNGESHTLTFENGEIYMASEKLALTLKLNRFRVYVENRPNEFKEKSVLKSIIRLQKRNEDVKRELINASRAVESSKNALRKEDAQADFEKLSKEVHDFGKEFKLNDLTAPKGNKLHNKFFPYKIKTELLDGGGKRITYGYEEGNQKFTVDIPASGYPTKVVGDQLTLHDLGRGYTQDPDGKVKNTGMDAAHIIANMFGGSGYKIGENIVATSAEYNQKAMRKREDEIRDFIEQTVDVKHFLLEVSLQYSEDNTIFEMSEIREQLAKYASTDDERHQLSDEDLKARILENLKKTSQKRLKEVYYDLYVHLKDGSVINKDFEIKEADLLYGTK